MQPLEPLRLQKFLFRVEMRVGQHQTNFVPGFIIEPSRFAPAVLLPVNREIVRHAKDPRPHVCNRLSVVELQIKFEKRFLREFFRLGTDF